MMPSTQSKMRLLLTDDFEELHQPKTLSTILLNSSSEKKKIKFVEPQAEATQNITEIFINS